MAVLDRIRALFQAEDDLELTARQIAHRLNVKVLTVGVPLSHLYKVGFLARRHDVGHHRGGNRRLLYRKALPVPLPERIEQFLREHPGEHHVDTVANALGIVSTTASRHLLDMTHAGVVIRRRDIDTRTGIGGQRRWLYRLAPKETTP